MRQWARALTDHRCAFDGCHIRKNDMMQILTLPTVASKFLYCLEHAQGKPAVDVPMLPSEMELNLANNQARIDKQREQMTRLRDLAGTVLSGRDRQVKE